MAIYQRLLLSNIRYQLILIDKRFLLLLFIKSYYKRPLLNFQPAVEQIPLEPCRINDEFTVTSTSGFIVSTMASESTSCDGQLHPWVISVPRGQRVNLTLYDFVRPVRRNGTTVPDLSWTTRDPGGRQCRDYGKIADSGRKETVALCGSDRRVSPGVYLSRGNVVRVWLFVAAQGQVQHPRNATRFLLGYSRTYSVG